MTFTPTVRGLRVGLSGFPFVRQGIRQQFEDRLERMNVSENEADIRFLCIHQAVEGATVGPVNFTFRSGDDVIPGAVLPEGFAAVLAGHIHRVQILTEDLKGRELAAPVSYPGSIDRTSFAERDEEKGYYILEAAPSDREGGRIVQHEFKTLPARPMVDVPLDVAGCSGEELARKLRHAISRLDPDSIVRVTISGDLSSSARSALSADELRRLAPAEMNLDLRFPRESQG
jgi:DNA repair exonuclease SbcCD nuclease subunit